ncbi:MAG: nitroreductase family protein [Dehalococcoidia bacterium]|nr:nitroreductase family protein [Dehalococcoidia bacterium]
MSDEMGLFEAMYSQRALRRLKPGAVPDELVRRLIEAATKAPSGGNREPWAFMVIRDAASKEKIGEWYLDAWNKTYGVIPDDTRANFPKAFARVYRSAEHLAHHVSEVPVLILVCARDAPQPDAPQAAVVSYYGSVYPAVQNLLLAARGLGLAATLTTLHKLHEDEVKALLGIPETAQTIALIPVGYPVDKFGPTTRRPPEEVTHYERWDSSKS